MLKFRTLSTAALIAGLTLAGIVKTGFAQRQQAPQPPLPMPAVLKDYAPVTAERLLRPEDGWEGNELLLAAGAPFRPALGAADIFTRPAESRSYLLSLKQYHYAAGRRRAEMT